MKDIFTKIYNNNSWQGDFSRSGPSSNLRRTEELRKNLPILIKKFKINSLLDLPCGDFAWFKELINKLDISYMGGDVVDELIIENKKKYQINNRISFKSIDITKDELPRTDLLFCRDLLFHFSYKDIFKTLDNILNSEIKYIMLTSHLNLKIKNKDIVTGGWRWFNLFNFPFYFPNPISKIIDGGGDRQMCLWSRDQLLKFCIKKSNEIF
jgi:hypothetical protein